MFNFFSLREKVAKRVKNLAGLSLGTAKNYGKNRFPRSIFLRKIAWNHAVGFYVKKQSSGAP